MAAAANDPLKGVRIKSEVLLLDTYESISDELQAEGTQTPKSGGGRMLAIPSTTQYFASAANATAPLTDGVHKFKQEG